MTNVIGHAVEAERPVGAPLGPESLTWKLFGDWRLQFLGPRAGILENMLPELGQGVLDHSVFFADPYARVQRSLPPIFRTVYAGEDNNEGATVRDFHANIKGEMPDGSRYHALNPETYYWAHATFLDVILSGADRFIRKLSLAEKEQLYAESITWYRRYGVSERAMAATFSEFETYWNHVLDDILVPHKTAMYGVGYVTAGLDRVPAPKGVPAWVWHVIARTLSPIAAFITTGGLPPRTRRQLNLPWTDRQERRYQRFCAGIRALNPILGRMPARLRLNRFAREGFTKAGVRPRST